LTLKLTRFQRQQCCFSGYSEPGRVPCDERYRESSHDDRGSDRCSLNNQLAKGRQMYCGLRDRVMDKKRFDKK